MKNHTLRAAILLPLIFLAAPSAPAQVASSLRRATPTEIDQAVDRARREVPAIAKAFGWEAQVPVIDGAGLDTRADRVSLNRGQMTRLLGETTEYTVEDAALTIVAHEVWHFVDLKRGITMPASSAGEERRLYECRADLMAGRYVTSTSSQTPPEDFFYSYAQSAARDLWTKPSADHPKPKQRALAAHFGALSLWRERPETTAEQRAQIDIQIGEGSGTDLAGWAQQACERITHFGQDAVGSIIAEDPTFTVSGDDTVFDLSFRNFSSRFVKVSTTLVVTYSDYQEGQPGEFRTWSFPVTFTVAPGARHRVKQMLTGFKAPNPSRLHFSSRLSEDDTLVTAAFVVGAPSAAAISLGSNLSAGDISFALAMQRLANDAPNAFSRHRGAGARLQGNTSLSIPLTIEIPGLPYASISLYNEGSSSILGSLYNGESADAARKAYSEARARFARIWPGAKIVDTESTDFSTFTIKLTRYSRITVSMGSTTYDGRTSHYVLLRMTPDALGLVD